ncbi:MAG: prepilin-type N-terminal cleavage/methylation domain-containing protein [Proteobacteria bacterium]|nr:prepilin-type N-terminal cleavage/methylation domain-containing protein [Pseudomonadota bacterium]
MIESSDLSYRTGRKTRRQSGLTLIELMIALLISALLVGLVFAIYTRMSVAYRGQSGVSELQQTLRAAKAEVVRHVRAAGHLIPRGFYASDNVLNALNPVPVGPGLPAVPATVHLGKDDLVPPVQVFNDPDGFGPDSIRVYYADASAMARIESDAPTTLTVDHVDNFQDGDWAVIVRAPTTTANTAIDPDAGPAQLVQYEACLVRISGVTDPDTLTLDPAELPEHDACGIGTTPADDITTDQSMIYRFVGRAFRIDPADDPPPPDPVARQRLSVLQISESGEIGGNDWTDLGIGFTDFQITRRYWLDAPGANFDGDSDDRRDWYSSDAVNPPANAELIEVNVSLAVRTNRDLGVVSTAATPAFTKGDIDHNQLGDSPSIALPSAVHPRYTGNHIYRWTSVRIDLRNMGIGR